METILSLNSVPVNHLRMTRRSARARVLPVPIVNRCRSTPGLQLI